MYRGFSRQREADERRENKQGRKVERGSKKRNDGRKTGLFFFTVRVFVCINIYSSEDY